jgi:hypothetical protein
MAVYMGQHKVHIRKILPPFLQVHATPKTIHLDLGFKMLQQDQGVHMTANDR